ncbi:MAG: ELM1/GtrOC1 family putative glycosyltransferase [Candidatus Omnitrophota bacterium]
MLDLIASVLVRGLNAVFHVMPIGFNLWLGRRFGSLACLLSGRRKHVTYANIKAAFCREKTPKQIKRIVKNAYMNMTQVFMEIVSFTKVDDKYIDKYVKVSNLDNLKKVSGNPGGMILLSGHFGNWELSIIASVKKGYPLHILARDQKMKRLNELFNALREKQGNIVIRKGADIRSIFNVLKSGKGLGILADQNAGANGRLIDLFGRPASSAMGPYKFAQKCGSIIVPAFTHRRKGPYHEVVVEPPMIIKKDEDIVPYMEEYNRLLEKHIREDPGQWLWMHKRWKATPLKKILVLNDGKKGHLNQSLAAVEQIKNYRRDEGYKDKDLEVEIADVKYKSKLSRILFFLATPFINGNSQGRLLCLSRALEKDCFRDLAARYADVIVSSGSALAGVNKALKIENYARNLTVMDPGFLNRRAFDLIIVLRHDIKSARRDNIVITELAPNLIERSSSKVESDAKACVGLLFGGENKHFTFSDSLTRSVADVITKVCGKKDGYFSVTTSRRTSPSTERILRDIMSDSKRCRRFVVGTSDENPDTVRNVLSESDVVIVSGESISMVSEAVSSGKKVLIFMPDKRTGKITKYEKFVQGLQVKGYIKIAVPGKDMSDKITSALDDKSEPVVPDDNKLMRDKMYKLF